MRPLLTILFKVGRRALSLAGNTLCRLWCRFIFYCLNVEHGRFQTNGVPYVSVAAGGRCTIGSGFKMNNTLRGNPIGRPQRCILFVDKGAHLKIGDNVGISQAALVCHESISVGNYVKIGGGVCIYDTDFHSIHPATRRDPDLDIRNKAKSPVTIKDNAFIGAHSIILKGVSIGENSIIGAGSVVTKNVPDNEIWAGNPAKKIKSIELK